jgi:PUA domain protein
MPKELRVRRRFRVRSKDVAKLSSELKASLGVELDEGAALDSGDYDNVKVYISGGRILAFESEGRIVPSLRLLVASQPKLRQVTVDMGAVKFVCNGADIMGPGIVAADPSIAVGDLVWINEQNHGKPLAVGAALVAGVEMVRGKGKAVRSFHHVGDSLWEFED